jgi:hypothetical protein
VWCDLWVWRRLCPDVKCLFLSLSLSSSLFLSVCRILNEADYQKHKEIDYHEQTVSMNQAAMWFPMIQVSENVITE